MIFNKDGGLARFVVLTGAGISAESGLATFRGPDGLWDGYHIEDVATPMAWMKNPELVWRFYQQRRKALLDVEPNAAHLALVRLEEALTKNMDMETPFNGHIDDWLLHWESFVDDAFILITQNVDDLHFRAGNNRVIPMHGQLRLLRCELTGKILEMMDETNLDSEQFVSNPEGGGRMRPHIVWFHEQPLGLHAISHAISRADVFLVVGTSGHVYPAAGLAHEAGLHGAQTILVNLEQPANAHAFDEIHLGPATQILPLLIDEWLEEFKQGC